MFERLMCMQGNLMQGELHFKNGFLKTDGAFHFCHRNFEPPNNVVFKFHNIRLKERNPYQKY